MQDPNPRGPPNATAPYMEDHAPATTTPPAEAGKTTGTIFAGPRTISRTTATPAAMPHSVLPTVSDHCTPAIRGKTTTSTPHSCTPPLLVTIKGGGRLPLDTTPKKDASGRDPSSLTLRHPYSPRSTPLLAETWEPSSLSRLACTPYYKHSGCKIIHCPRTPSLLDVRPRSHHLLGKRSGVATNPSKRDARHHSRSPGPPLRGPGLPCAFRTS